MDSACIHSMRAFVFSTKVLSLHKESFYLEDKTMAVSVKKNIISKEASKMEHIEMVNKRKHNKTWAAAMKTQGSLTINDPNLQIPNENRRYSKTYLAALKTQGSIVVNDPNLM